MFLRLEPFASQAVSSLKISAHQVQPFRRSQGTIKQSKKQTNKLHTYKHTISLISKCFRGQIYNMINHEICQNVNKRIFPFSFTQLPSSLLSHNDALNYVSQHFDRVQRLYHLFIYKIFGCHVEYLFQPRDQRPQ